jgi:hypothetical protein
MINKQETKKGFQPKKEKNRMLEKGYKGKKRAARVGGSERD